MPKSQDRSGTVGRVPRLLRHGTIRGGALEAQGKGLKILLTLVEGIGRFSGENKCLVCIFYQIVYVSLWICFPQYCSIKKKKTLIHGKLRSSLSI